MNEYPPTPTPLTMIMMMTPTPLTLSASLLMSCCCTPSAGLFFRKYCGDVSQLGCLLCRFLKLKVMQKTYKSIQCLTQNFQSSIMFSISQISPKYT